jgi:hypothetical protein
MSDTNHVTLIAGLAATIGIARLAWPEFSRLVREMWEDFTAAVHAVLAFWRSLKLR